jgi:hypothetical protein
VEFEADQNGVEIMAINEKEKQLAAKMLKDFSHVVGRNVCNDFDFPSDWTAEEINEFCNRYHEWNGDSDEIQEPNICLPDYAIAVFLAHLIGSK